MISASNFHFIWRAFENGNDTVGRKLMREWMGYELFGDKNQVVVDFFDIFPETRTIWNSVGMYR